MPSLITRDLVALDADLGAQRQDVIRALAQKVVDAGRATSVDGLAMVLIGGVGTVSGGVAGAAVY